MGGKIVREMQNLTNSWNTIISRARGVRTSHSLAHWHAPIATPFLEKIGRTHAGRAASAHQSWACARLKISDHADFDFIRKAHVRAP